MRKLLLLLWVCLSAQGAAACSLAIHDWQLRFCLKLTPGFSLLPFAEMDVLHERIASGSVNAVSWVGGPVDVGPLWSILIALISGREERAAWHLIPSPRSIPGLAAAGAGTIAIIGSDQHSLRLALFSDRNSLFRCHQLILYETKRIRAIHADPASPWAHETIGRAWISAIFHRLPVPGSILSVSASPLHGTIADLFTDIPFIETLVDKGILKRRPASEYTPESKQIPEIPE